MTAVLSALGTLIAVVALGWLLGRTGVLGDGVQEVLARLVFTVATPALLVVTIAAADLGLLLSRPALVAAASTSGIAVLAAVVLRWGLRRSAAETTVGTLAASYVNAAILGLPLAVYLLDDALAVVPVLLFQLLVLSPLAITVLGSRAPGAVPGLQGVLSRTFRNPILVAALVGLLLAALPWTLPDAVSAPFTLVGAVAAPLALITFGMSLSAPRPPGVARPSADLVLVVVLRSVLHPVLAYAVARALGMDGPALLAVVTMAALPTGQNVLVYAMHYGKGKKLARDAGLTTTVLSLPVLLVVSALLG